MANHDARPRPIRSARRCSAPAIGNIPVVTSTQRKTAVIGGYNEVAVESEFETTTERSPSDRGDRRHPERFDGAARHGIQVNAHLS
jgi:hypothetical protein